MSYHKITSTYISPAQQDFPGFEFTKYDSGYYGINAYGIHYIMPYNYAKQFVEFAKTQHASFSDAQKWYEQLNEAEKQFIVRYDLSNEKYL